MINYKEEYEDFLLANDAFDDLVRALRKDEGKGLRHYLLKYDKEPSKILYHAPFNWQESGQGDWWKILDRKWAKYCEDNNLE